MILSYRAFLRRLSPYLFAALLAGTARADLIAEFGFDGSSLASTDPSTSWSTSDLDSGGGVPETFDGSTGQPAPSLSFTMGHINDGTLLDDDFYFFTVTPDGGITLDYTELSVDLNKLSGGADVFGRLYSSIDSFTSEIGFVNESNEGDGFNNYTIDLSALAPQSTPTTFRFYLETGGTFGPNGIRLDNLEMTASVIPEPTTLVLVGSGALMIMAARRRRLC